MSTQGFHLCFLLATFCMHLCLECSTQKGPLSHIFLLHASFLSLPFFVAHEVCKLISFSMNLSTQIPLLLTKFAN
jgi:hypothetical protein